MTKQTMKKEDVPSTPIEEEMRKCNIAEVNRKENEQWKITRTDSINYHSNSEDVEAKDTDDKKKITMCENVSPTSMHNPIGINFAPNNEECMEEVIKKETLKKKNKRKVDGTERKMTTLEEIEPTKTQNKGIYTTYTKHINDEIQKECQIKNIELERFFENVKRLNQMSVKRNTETTKSLGTNIRLGIDAQSYIKNEEIEYRKKKQLKKFLDAEEDINFFLEYKRMNPDSTVAIRNMTLEPIEQKQEPIISSKLDNIYANNNVINNKRNINLLSNNEINYINAYLSNVAQMNQGKESTTTTKVDNTYPDKKSVKRFIRTSKNIKDRLEKIEHEIIEHQMKYNKDKKISVKHIQKNTENREQPENFNLNQYAQFQRANKFTLNYNSKDSSNLKQILNHMNENYCKKERMNTVLDSSNIHILYKELQRNCGNVSQMLDILYDADTKHDEEGINLNQQCLHNSKEIPYNFATNVSNENTYQGTSKSQIKSSIYDRTSKKNNISIMNHSVDYDKRNYEQFLKRNETHYGVMRNLVSTINADRKKEKELSQQIHKNEDTRKNLDTLRKRIENYNNSKNNLSMYNEISVPSTKYLNTLFDNRIEEMPNSSEIKILGTNNASSYEPFKSGMPGPINPIINANLISEVELEKLKCAFAEEKYNMCTREQTTKQNGYKKFCVLKKMSNDEDKQEDEKANEFLTEVRNSIHTNFLNQTYKNPKELQEPKINMNEHKTGKNEVENRKRNRDHETKNKNVYIDHTNGNGEIEDYENVSFECLQQEVKKNIIRILMEEQLQDHAILPYKEFQTFPASNRNYPTLYPVKKKHSSIDNIMKNKSNVLQNNSLNEMNKQEKNQKFTNEINEIRTSEVQVKNISSDHNGSLTNNAVVPNVKKTVVNEYDWFQKKTRENNPVEEINKLIDGIKNTLPSNSEKKMNPLDIIDTTNSLYEKMLNIFYEEGFIKDKNTHQLREVHFKTGAVLKTKYQFVSALKFIKDDKKSGEGESQVKFTIDTTPKNENTQGGKKNHQKCLNHENMFVETNNINGNNYKLENREVSRMSTKTSLISRRVSSNKMNANDQSSKEHKYKDNHN